MDGGIDDDDGGVIWFPGGIVYLVELFDNGS
jgi:hypothetical protein